MTRGEIKVRFKIFVHFEITFSFVSFWDCPKKDFFNKYWPGVTAVLISNMLLQGLRDYRDAFQVEIWEALYPPANDEEETDPAIFTITELPVKNSLSRCQQGSWERVAALPCSHCHADDPWVQLRRGSTQRPHVKKAWDRCATRGRARD